MDKLSKKERSELMSRVRISGTDIEEKLLKLVKLLWKIERYRKNVKKLPGKPDIVFLKSKIAIFADGDFWHGRNFKKWRKKVPKFWLDKITNNMERDLRQTKELKKMGYKVLRFWGSDIKKSSKVISKKIKNKLLL